ncbi:endonuclease/exonuclease/phosphatase family protein [Aspergillus terreus]|uniref:Endonuclease/exonuclease/phosphatase family protein n=1 Tax=Aspergillus terreus TaxID=33178 RepID=A0A5M3ZDE8_ASPTE|nr:hypothetical protein ATETN484_0012012600 [Aspergillus terreus]GFF19374.1 endonuclease/exonuclease/phosphatase family protein [Aspergillus terreus]
MKIRAGLWASSSLFSHVLALTIGEINGKHYLSPYQGKNVSDIKGLVTAKGSSGFYLRSTRSNADSPASDSIYVYGKSAVSQVSVGDIISLDGEVSEYRSSQAYVYLTEIISPTNIEVASHDNEVTPLVIGQKGLVPPTEEFSDLDHKNVFGVPNNVSQISHENPKVKPSKYGMDFWESLSGELVQLKGVHALTKPNRYGDTWVLGGWDSTGQNERGGLTMAPNDANPEAIIIGSPLDGSSNPTNTKIGDTIDDITGVITQAYGYYRLLPLTALTVTGSNETAAMPTTLTSNGSCSAMAVGSYNVENLTPNSTHLSKIAGHIVEYLKCPTVMFLQEIQDNNGATDDGVVSANRTLSTLIREIQKQGGIKYDFVNIDPVDGRDGGEPGGNIRVAYLYDPSVVRLRNANPGSSTDANEVLSGAELKYNPGLIDPSNSAWADSRKPLAAAWETLEGQARFFTVNVHFTSKGGGSSIEGDARPPVNGGIDQRSAQAKVVGKFISEILLEDSRAKIITAGDFNEFAFARPLEVFSAVSGLQDLDDVAGVSKTERYTYLYDANCQQLDHMYVSDALTTEAQIEHIHVNTWVAYEEQASDHDPTVALLNVCV